MTTQVHRYLVRVYVEDTDFQGFVYHANYLKFMERARTEWLRAAGLNQTDASHHGCFYVVTGLEIRYHQPAALDDQLEVLTHVVRRKRVTLQIAQDIRRINDQSLVTSASVRIGYLTKQLQPHPLPAFRELATTEFQ
ncbi:MAG: YbgC/FadM family acyl-CoA thioesterase [Legionellales bacterium]|nr:YbgC/FadM family acyl-CoA thioesterase [Legionellales bacterium]